MAVWLAVCLALALCYAGMAGLCLSMARHYQQVWGGKPGRLARLGLRCAGWLLLALALLPCAAAWGVAVGVVVWLGFLSAGALVLAWLLAYRPRSAAALALGGALPALSALALHLPV